jgi:hypothetical protein
MLNRKPPVTSDSDALVRQLESHARQLTEMGLPGEGESELKSFDEVFAHMREICPELVDLALENNRLTELNKLVEYLREKINNGVMAGHWLKQGDEKFTEQELSLYYLKDLIRRVGMNLDGEHMEAFEGKPGELISCHLPPAVAHDLYRVSYPLIVDQGVRELTGEAEEVPSPPANLNHDIFFGRVDTESKYKPGTVLRIDENGDPKVVSTPPEGDVTPDTIRKVEIAIRQEVTRQGHQVASLRVWPTGRDDLVSVELRVADSTRGFDNSALKKVIEKVLTPTVPMVAPKGTNLVKDATRAAKDAILRFPQSLKF